MGISLLYYKQKYITYLLEPKGGGNMAETTAATGIFSDQPHIVTPTYKQQAYDLIKDAIIYQRFRADAIYSQEGICQELGISRTPVREALLELQKEGYVYFYRGKGIKIVSIGADDIYDILEIRLYTERICASLAAQRATKKDLEKMSGFLDEIKKNLDSKDGVMLYHLDHQFHRALAEASHNSWLLRNIEDILDNYLRFEVKTVYNNLIDANSVLDEHRAIYEAVKSGNSEKAQQAAERHLERSYNRTLSKYWKKK